MTQLLYREFDLCEWLGGGTITNLYACMTGEAVANVVLRLDNDVVASVEASISLPANEQRQDRHEIITRRGVACDRVVDTQVAQQSVYLFKGTGTECYSDTDAELYGLPPAFVSLVRAAFRYLQNPQQRTALQSRHQHLAKAIAAAFESAAANQRLKL